MKRNLNLKKYEMNWCDDLNHPDFPQQTEYFATIEAARKRMKELVEKYKSYKPCGFWIFIWKVTVDQNGQEWHQGVDGFRDVREVKK